MVLHQLNRSPQHADTLAACLRAAAEGDTVLLIEDGVYHAASAQLLQQHPGLVFCVLEADLQARGLAGQCPAGFRRLDDRQWVELACVARAVCSWN